MSAWQNGRLAADEIVAFMAPYDAYSTLTLMHFPGRGELHAFRDSVATCRVDLNPILHTPFLSPRRLFHCRAQHHAVQIH